MHIEDKDIDNLRIPQYYYNSRGKKEYVELCRDIFQYNKENLINEVHKRIIDFNVSTIITTNYTNFLEREMDNRGHIYRVICQDKDLPYVKNENLIIKMHGDFEHDNFVLKEDDYLSYSNHFRLIETYIKSIIAKNVVLFIEYSFNDPDIKQLFSWVKDILGNDFQQAYMLNGFDDYDKNVFDYYRNLGVNVIFTKNLGEAGQDAQSILLNMMNMIRIQNIENLPNVEIARDYLASFSDYNYVLGKYVNIGLQKCGLVLDVGKLKSIEQGKGKESEENQLLLKILERLDGNTLNEDNPYEVIANIIKKSGTFTIEMIESRKKEILYILYYSV